MENATKALLMAAGVLLVMMIIAVLLFAWNTFSNYYTSQDELVEIDNLAKFNEQFTQYDRDNVMGYELISLANKVADYNFRYSKSDGSKNNEGYSPITLTINYKNKAKNFAYTTENKLFTGKYSESVTQSDVNNGISNILNEMANIESLYGSADVASKIAKNINILYLEEASLNYYNKKKLTDNELKALKELIVQNYNALVKNEHKVSKYEDIPNDIKSDKVYQYYEYYQFKRGKFNCSALNFDNITGRVSQIVFEFTGDIE